MPGSPGGLPGSPEGLPGSPGPSELDIALLGNMPLKAIILGVSMRHHNLATHPTRR
jgi:hypothetical protein